MKRLLTTGFHAMALVALSGMVACHPSPVQKVRASEEARYFEVDSSYIVSISPYDGSRDTLFLEKPLSNVVCLSSTHLAYLDAIEADSVVTGVSGIRYISNPDIQVRHAAGEVFDVGYDAALDYERLVALQPDVILAYTVSAMKPNWLVKLHELGLRVFVLYDNLEEHPLARASYIRMAGALTGRLAAADSVYEVVASHYHEIAARMTEDSALEEDVEKESHRPLRGKDSASDSEEIQISGGKDDRLFRRPKVLINIPYNDQWYIPGKDNYMTRLIEDAGGEVLGAVEGKSESSVISLEEAVLLAQEADVWLNPGWCRTREQLYSIHPLFGKFGIPAVYNNVKKVNAGGGNDFWELGAARPDLILSDLYRIFQSFSSSSEDKGEDDDLYFYISL